MIVVIRQGGVDRGRREMGELKSHFLDRRPVSKKVCNNLNHFNVCVIDPNPPRRIHMEMGV